MGKTKIIFRKLNATGHSTMHLDDSQAFNEANLELKAGNYLYLEPQKKVITKRDNLNLKGVTEILVIPPVVGG